MGGPMTERKRNLFEKIKQTKIDTGDGIFWVDDDDLDNFSDDIEENPEAILDTREINGKTWNEQVIGAVYDDYQGTFLDEDCPECGHLMVRPNNVGNIFDDKMPTTWKHCSNYDCEYATPEMKKAWEDEKQRWEDMKNAPPAPQFRVEGETFQQFCERVGMQMDGRKGRNNYQLDECVRCKKQALDPSDFYQTKEYAIAVFHHEGCDNGPSVCLPLGEKQKEWAELLGTVRDHLSPPDGGAS